MLRANNLTIEYKTLLFKDLSFILGNNEKVALVGLNGCGKSTLIKIIAGEVKPDIGSIEKVGEEISYLPQEFNLGEFELVGEYLESLVENPLSERYKVDKILGKLDWHDIDDFQAINTLSPGQQMKLYLVGLLVNEPTILLLDEPTNHLDIAGIEWLEDFVNGFPGIVITISHDREFLNNTVDWVFEIDEQQLNIFPGNYDDYEHQKIEFIANRQEQYKRQEQKRAQLEQQLILARKFGDGKKRKAAIRSVKTKIERDVTRHEVGQYQKQQIRGLNIAGSVHQSKRILQLENISFGYTQEQKLLQNINWEVYGNQKIWLYGANGIGKTTLLKLLIGELQPTSGSVQWGENLQWEYFSQVQAQLPENETLAEYFCQQTNIPWQHRFKPLAQFLFPREMHELPLKRLSPGQRARLIFAIFSQHAYECLVLDEPTNHLDLQTKQTIEQALAAYQGAVLLVSHDRAFAKAIQPDRVVTIENGVLVELAN